MKKSVKGANRTQACYRYVFVLYILAVVIQTCLMMICQLCFVSHSYEGMEESPFWIPMISVLYTRVELMLASRMLSTPLVCEDLMRLVDDLQGRIDTLKNDNEKLRRQLSQILHALSSERPKVNYINIYGGQNQILPDARWAEQTGDGMG